MANGNGNWKIYLSLTLSLAVVIGGGLIAWGQVTNQVDSLKEDVKGLESARDTTIELKVDVEYIKKELEKQDQKLDKILEKLD